jgi:hypothetical protein
MHTIQFEFPLSIGIDGIDAIEFPYHHLGISKLQLCEYLVLFLARLYSQALLHYKKYFIKDAV